MFNIIKYCECAKSDYLKTVTSGNDPKITQKMRYSQYVKSAKPTTQYNSSSMLQLQALGLITIPSLRKSRPHYSHWGLFPAVGEPLYYDASGNTVRDANGSMLRDASGDIFGIAPGTKGSPLTGNLTFTRGPYIL
jgi:hypothetical protein